MAKNRSAAEIIAFHFCADIRDIHGFRYQPSRLKVAAYAIGDAYYCAPPAGAAMPFPAEWTEIGEHYGRKVYKAVA